MHLHFLMHSRYPAYYTHIELINIYIYIYSFCDAATQRGSWPPYS